MIYFVLAREVSRVKIGITENLHKLVARLSALESNSPCKLELLEIFDNKDLSFLTKANNHRLDETHHRDNIYSDRTIESFLAKELSYAHYKGEWYDFNENVKTYLFKLIKDKINFKLSEEYELLDEKKQAEENMKRILNIEDIKE